VAYDKDFKQGGKYWTSNSALNQVSVSGDLEQQHIQARRVACSASSRARPASDAVDTAGGQQRNEPKRCAIAGDRSRSPWAGGGRRARARRWRTTS
jgi:hypothetical protein